MSLLVSYSSMNLKDAVMADQFFEAFDANKDGERPRLAASLPRSLVTSTILVLIRFSVSVPAGVISFREFVCGMSVMCG